MIRSGVKALCVLLLTPAAATAAPSYLDLYYVPDSRMELGDPDPGNFTATSDGGSGVGFRGRIAASDILAIQAEYQKDEYDGFQNTGMPTDTTTLRFGVRLGAERSPSYALFEYVELTLDIQGVPERSDSGYGGHVGLEGRGPVRAYTQVGFVDVGDFGNGLEFMGGMVADFGSGLGIFLDYRQTRLEEDSGAEMTPPDVRVGARIAFGRLSTRQQKGPAVRGLFH